MIEIDPLSYEQKPSSYYADELVRGISSKQDLSEDGYPLIAAFLFRNNSERCTHKLECSINWRDDDEAESSIWSEQNDNLPKYKGGLVVLSRIDLVKELTKGRMRGVLQYERYEVEGNKYHGNLLIPESCDKRDRTSIQCAICDYCVIPSRTRRR